MASFEPRKKLGENEPVSASFGREKRRRPTNDDDDGDDEEDDTLQHVAYEMISSFLSSYPRFW